MGFEAVLSTGVDGWSAFEDAEDRILAYKDTGEFSQDDRIYFSRLVIGQLLDGVTLTSGMSDEEEFTTLNGLTFTYYDNPTSPLFNNAMGTSVDVVVSNGVVHFVDAVVQGGTSPNSPTPPTPTPPVPITAPTNIPIAIGSPQPSQLNISVSALPTCGPPSPPDYTFFQSLVLIFRGTMSAACELFLTECAEFTFFENIFTRI